MQLLFLSEWFSDEILKAMSWTLVHSLWQGLIAAVIAGVIIINTKKTSARLRYNLLGALLVLFLLTVAFTMRFQTESIGAAAPVANVSDNNEVFTNVEMAHDQLMVPANGPAGRLIQFLNEHANLIMLVWGMFFLFNCIKIFTGIGGVHRLRTRNTHTADEWQIKLNQLSKAIGIHQSVRLLQSELVKVPVAIGFFKPVILVPLGLLSHLPADQVETILLHELAHIRRRDYLINILQRFTEAVFFFNPALLWMSSLIRQEREACCDDIVVANTTHKGCYLEALVSFQEYSLSTSGYAMGISSKKHYLLNRVRRMLTRENKKLDLMEKILLIIGVTVVSAFTFMPKEEPAVPQQPVRQSVKRAEEKPEPENLATPSSASISNRVPVHKMTTRKETVKPISQSVAVRDTVPPQKTSSSSESKSSEQTSFQSMSTNFNNDGNTKKSTVTVVDLDGKKYSLSKVNDKITSFSVDGNVIPENEISKYSSIIEKIDRTVENNREKRKALEAQKAAMKEERSKRVKEGEEKRKEHFEKQNEKRKADFEKQRMETDKRRTENLEKLDEKRKDDFEKQRKEIDKRRKENSDKLDEKRKDDFEKQRKELDKQRKEIEKQRKELEIKKEDLNKQRKEKTGLFTPKDERKKLFLNGREVVQDAATTDQTTAENKPLPKNGELEFKTKVGEFKTKGDFRTKLDFIVVNKTAWASDKKMDLRTNKDFQIKQVKLNLEKCPDEPKVSKKPAPPKQADPAAAPEKKDSKKSPSSPNRPKQASKFKYSQGVIT